MAQTNRRSIRAARRSGGGASAFSALGALAPGHKERHTSGRDVELDRRRRTRVAVAAGASVVPEPLVVVVVSDAALSAPGGGGGRVSSGGGGASRASSRPGVRERGVGRRRRRVPTSARKRPRDDTSRPSSAPDVAAGSSGPSPGPLLALSMGGGWPSSPGRFGWCPNAPDVDVRDGSTVLPASLSSPAPRAFRIILRSRALGYDAEKFAGRHRAAVVWRTTPSRHLEDARRACRDPNQPLTQPVRPCRAILERTASRSSWPST